MADANPAKNPMTKEDRAKVKETGQKREKVTLRAPKGKDAVKTYRKDW